MNVGSWVLKQRFKEHPEIMWKSYQLCEIHFTKSSFRTNLKRKMLKCTAVPIPISSTEFNAESCKVDHGYSMEPPYEDETVSPPTKTTSLQTQNSTSILAIGADPQGEQISDFHDPDSPLQETAPDLHEPESHRNEPAPCTTEAALSSFDRDSHMFESQVGGLIILVVILLHGPVIYINR